MHNRSILSIASLFLLLSAPAAWSQQVTLEAPAELSVGQAFEVIYTSDGDPADFVSFTDAGAEINRYNYGWHRASAGSPAKFSAPTNPGTCAVRFITEEPRVIVVEKQIVVRDTSATVDVPTQSLLAPSLSSRPANPAR